MLRAGDLNRRVALSRPTTTKNGFNEDVVSFAPVATVWSSYQPLSDAEQRRAAEVGATMTARFQIRRSTTVVDCDPTWRLEFDGRAFDIVGVKEIGLREGLEISAVARGEKPA